MKWDFPLVMYSGLLLSFCLLKTHPFIPVNCTLTFRSASIFECNNPKFNQPMDRTKFMTCCCFLSFFLKIRFTWIAITRRKICHYFQFIVTNSLETFLGHYSNVSKFVTLAMWTQMFLLPLKLWIVVILNHVIIRSSCSSRSAVIKTDEQQAKYWDIFQIESFFSLTLTQIVMRIT